MTKKTEVKKPEHSPEWIYVSTVIFAFMQNASSVEEALARQDAICKMLDKEVLMSVRYPNRKDL